MNQLAFPTRRVFVIALGINLSLAAAVMTAKGEDAGKNPAPEGEKVVLFNGKDLTRWRPKDESRKETWQVVSSVKLDDANKGKLVGEGSGGPADGVLFRQPVEHGTDIYTEKSFGSGEYHVEFMIPKGSNSGVYLQGQYEVQVFDSYGKEKVGAGDVGGIYNTKAPDENAAKAPGEWQTFDIVFRAPRFDAAGKKIENALFVSVKLNGKTIHGNVEAPKPTGGQLPGGEKAEGPLLFQGDHGIAAFRNVTFKPIAFREGKAAEGK